MAKEFEIIDHTADVGIIAYGSSIGQAFANAAKAMFSIITEPGDIREVLYRDIAVNAPDRDSLLVAWLNELNYIFDTENILFKRFEVNLLTDTRLEARSYGEKVDLSRHQLKIGIKAATYYMLSVDKDKDNSYRVRVIFDI